MANCNNLFSDFHDCISINSGKNERMMKSKNGLRERIRKWFKENHPDYIPKFYIQGSYKMKTGIRTKEDICDLDDGIYFLREPDVTASTLKKWVLEAVDGYTKTAAQNRKKCIRSIFSGDYEIDHPVYYKIDGKKYMIAVKDVGFEESDSRGVVDWFNERKDSAGRLIRDVKYLKAWCDNINHKMPSGLAMTILAANAKSKIVLNDRDDITLRDILREIQKTLNLKFECIVPALPYDDLFADYDENRKKLFLEDLDTFLKDADDAIREKNQLKASKLWRKHLGSRFPLGEDKNDESQRNSAAAIGASTSFPYGNE